MNRYENKSATVSRSGTKSLTMALACVTVSAGLLCAVEDAQAGRRVVKFTNKTGQIADDLHIKTKQGFTVDWGGTNPFNQERGVDGGNNHNLHGADVANNGDATVTMTSGSPKIEIKKWWWTKGGTALKDGKRISDIGDDDGSANLVCMDGIASGGGVVLVTCGGVDAIFETIPGVDSFGTTQMFEAFLSDMFWQDDFDLVHSSVVNENEVFVAGNLIGDEATQLHMELLAQDPTMQMLLLPNDQDTPMLWLSQFGQCGGVMAFEVVDATPGGEIAYVYGRTFGEIAVPGCPGAFVAIGDPVVADILIADNQGMTVLEAMVPAGACGRYYIQAVDLTGCAETNCLLIESDF